MAHAVMLDAQSLGPCVDLSPLRDQVNRLTVYDKSTAQDAYEKLADADIAIVNKVVLDTQTLAGLPRLKLICVMATGLNNIDLDTASAQGIAVKNVVGYGTRSVSQHAMMLILALANRLPRYQHDVANGKWQQSDFFCLQDHPTLELAGKHLVIVGQGELGSAVARLADAFGMRISFAARPGNEATDPRPSLDALLPDADVLSLHCPVTVDNAGIINARTLALLPDRAIVVNTARGALIDEEALVAALTSGKLFAAGLDVFRVEPVGNPALAALPNVFLLPHIGSATEETRDAMGMRALDNLDVFFAGEDPGDRVA